MGRWVASGLIRLILVAISMGVVPPSSAQNMTFGVTAQADTRADFEALTTFLSSTVGRTFGLYIAKDSDDLRARIEAGTVDLASFSPALYVNPARRQDPDHRAVNRRRLDGPPRDHHQAIRQWHQIPGRAVSD